MTKPQQRRAERLIVLGIVLFIWAASAVLNHFSPDEPDYTPQRAWLTDRGPACSDGKTEPTYIGQGAFLCYVRSANDGR